DREAHLLEIWRDLSRKVVRDIPRIHKRVDDLLNARLVVLIEANVVLIKRYRRAFATLYARANSEDGRPCDVPRHRPQDVVAVHSHEPSVDISKVIGPRMAYMLGSARVRIR